MKQRKFLAVFLLLLSSFVLIHGSNVRADIVAGKDYTVLTSPQPTQTSDRIEVLEFFWYGCPHCYSLNPLLKTWLTNLPSDVDFRYVPAIFRPNWAAGAKIFFTIETLGMMAVLHDKIYDAIHRDKIDLNDESILFDWIEKQGMDRKEFENTYNSFAIQNQVAKSTQISRQYQLTGVPALVINGKYVTSGKMGGTPQDTINTLEALIKKAREEK